MVSRIGLASGYGVPATVIEKASHEYGINYLYVSPFLNLDNMVQAIRNLDAGPLDEEEMARVRRIGKHIYGKK